MRGSPPRGQTWGKSFVHDPALKVSRSVDVRRTDDEAQRLVQQAVFVEIVAHASEVTVDMLDFER